MIRQYVGARYVPKFASHVAWASGTSYEALTIVTFNNASYTSKVPVPPTVGNPADNPDYWALTGNYNAQVEQYRQETETVSNSLTTLQGQITTEITNREHADATLQGQITTEIINRENADATLQNNIEAETTARQTADNTLQGNINSEVSTRAAADAALQGQIDNFVQLPSGSTTADAELVNIRVKADGTSATTAGDAVREQVTELKNDLNNINGSQIKTKQIDYSVLSVSENKKITGYNASTFLPILADESGSVVADFAATDVTKYDLLKFPRCSKSSQYVIIYGPSFAINYTKTSTANDKLFDLSNPDYGVLKCQNLKGQSVSTRIAIAFDYRVDLTVESQFDSFFDLMDTVNANRHAASVIHEMTENTEKIGIASVSMFEKIAAIGDSYTAGSTLNSAGTWKDYRNLSWIATMGKRSGTEWKNYGHGGATTKSFLETTEFTTALSDNACDCYFFALGQNDGNLSLTIGTIADIHDEDYTQNPETFYGCYGKIIQQIKDHAPNARLIMVTGWVQGATWTAYDAAIREIANHYSIPVIEPFEDYFFNSELYQKYKNNGHPTALGYSSMGIAMERLFSKCVNDNPSYFKFATIG